MQPRKVPQRQCLGCRQMFPKKQLIRVVRSQEGVVSLDETGKKAGRGAYVCLNPACMERVRKSRALDRAFGCPVEDEVLQALCREVEAKTVE